MCNDQTKNAIDINKEGWNFQIFKEQYNLFNNNHLQLIFVYLNSV